MRVNERKIDLLKVAFYLYFGLCSAYLTNLTRFSPYYIGLILLLISICVYSIKTKKIKVYKSAKNICIIVAIMVLYYFLVMLHSDTFERFESYIVIPLYNEMSIVLISLICSMTRIDRESLKKGIYFYYIIAFSFGIFDVIYRWVNRLLLYSGRLWFQNFKFNTIMFDDSNFVGFMYLIVFAFYLYLYCEWKVARKYQVLSFFCLVLLSFSRAAILAGIVTWGFYILQRLNKEKKSVLIWGVIAIGIVILIFFAVRYKDDYSLLTKLSIAENLINYLKGANVRELLLGNGINSSFLEPWLLGGKRSAHLYIAIKILDMGIVGLLLDLLLFLLFLKGTNGKGLYIIIPFGIAGLSMCPMNLSYMYVFMGIVFYIENVISKEGMEQNEMFPSGINK